MAKKIFVTASSFSIMDHSAAAPMLAAAAADAAVKPMLAHVAALGLAPQIGAGNVIGLQGDFTANEAVKPPPEFGSARGVHKITHNVVVQDYRKQGSKDDFALVTVTLTSDTGETVREARLLQSIDDNMDNAVEFKIEGGKVVPTTSWWTRGRDCILGRCVSRCRNALFTCPRTSWTVYLGCLAVRCGGCWVKCAACASCNCRWWCRWATGCCEG